MKIGIIGTGNMGRTLGTRWARAGHAVLFGSRDARKAEEVARAAAPSARAGDAAAAAAFGDAILYTVRGVMPSRLLRDPSALDGKVVIDCNNTDFDPVRGEFLPAPVPSLAEQVAADLPGALVVQAFSTIPQPVLALPTERLAARRVSAFLCSDHAAAKSVVASLASDLGLVPVDSGELRRARVVNGVVDFIRMHIAILGRGPFTTISLETIPEEAR
ncbi:MAG TPA: NAD(P)-binding domain-containing protein [Polyangia bacterium]|nr:NAD(P)-binding domain-containing protein [Polyangia bacterium]